MEDLIFGYQYYRAPTPRKCDWERDLQKIKRDGFNTVKFWVQWRWSNPKKGVYDWSDLDELMDIAQKVGLSVVLNFILDVVPTWVVKKYPESVMVTASGEKLYPRATICRQIGGAPGVCLNNDDTNKIRFAFVRKAVEHFSTKKALKTWDIWNEPELTVAIKRVPKYADLVCYCKSCQKKFRNYLKEKYQTVEKLNAVWGRNYVGFNEAEPPYGGGTYMDVVDWRAFFLKTVSLDAKKRVDVIKKFDKARREITCHTVLQPLLSSVSCGADTFEIAKYCDSIGNSACYDDFNMRLLLSAANGKPAYCSEIHITGGTTFIPYKEPSKQTVYKQVLQPLFNGIKGFKVWQYRQEILGQESPAWGTVNMHGEDTALYKELVAINDFVQENKYAFLHNEQKADIAVYMEHRDELFAFSGSEDLSVYNKSVTGAFNLLNDCNRNVDFINAERLEEEILKRYKIIYFCNLYTLTQREANAIAKFVESGGTAIFEGFFGIVNPNEGTYSQHIPCAGLAERFGVHLEGVNSAKCIENSYVSSQVELSKEIFSVGEEEYAGGVYKTAYRATGSKAVGFFQDGNTAVFEKAIGQGKIIVFNTLFAYSYGVQKNNNRKLLNSLLQLCEEEYQEVKTFSAVGENGEKILFLANNGDTEKAFALDGAYEIVFGAENAKIENQVLYLQKDSIVVLTESDVENKRKNLIKEN